MASAEGGPLEIVAPGTGFLATPGDPADLARALSAAIELAALPDTPQRCHDHARHWSWADRVGPAHEAVYRVALAGVVGPPPD